MIINNSKLHAMDVLFWFSLFNEQIPNGDGYWVILSFCSIHVKFLYTASSRFYSSQIQMWILTYIPCSFNYTGLDVSSSLLGRINFMVKPWTPFIILSISQIIQCRLWEMSQSISPLQKLSMSLGLFFHLMSWMLLTSWMWI